jgi:hypothetical protein
LGKREEVYYLDQHMEYDCSDAYRAKILSTVSVGLVLYVFGDDSRNPATMLKFETVEGIWSAVAPLPEPIYEPAVCSVGSNFYVFGGVDSEGGNLASVFKYDTVSGVWMTLAPMPHASYHHCASNVNGIVYILKAGVSGQESLCFDPASMAWSMLAPKTFNGSISIFTLSGCLHMVGGRGMDSFMERYDAATDTWTAIAELL